MSPVSFATGDLLPLPSDALVFSVSVLTAVVTAPWMFGSSSEIIAALMRFMLKSHPVSRVLRAGLELLGQRSCAGPQLHVIHHCLLVHFSLEQVAQDHVQETFGDPQGGRFRSLSGQSQNSVSLSPAISWVASQAANGIAAGPGAVKSCSFCLLAHPDVIGFPQDVTNNGLGCFYLHGSLGSFPLAM